MAEKYKILIVDDDPAVLSLLDKVVRSVFLRQQKRAVV